MLRGRLRAVASARYQRRDFPHEALEALRRGVVAEPQHEFGAAGRDVAPYLLRDLLDGADEVVVDVVVRVAAAPERTATGRREPVVEVALRVEETTVGCMR